MLIRNPNPVRQEYLRQWRKNHPDKISQYNKRYWERRLKREQMERKESEKDAGDHSSLSND